jgi:hexosaminidase
MAYEIIELERDEIFKTGRLSSVNLQQIGGMRSHDIQQISSLLPYFGSGPYRENATGTGYYSVNDYRDIFRHASRLHIDIIPEVGLPGHSHAAVQSMRRRHAMLSSAADGRKFSDYQLSDREDKTVYEAYYQQKHTIVNSCLQSTFKIHVLPKTAYSS